MSTLSNKYCAIKQLGTNALYIIHKGITRIQERIINNATTYGLFHYTWIYSCHNKNPSHILRNVRYFFIHKKGVYTVEGVHVVLGLRRIFRPQRKLRRREENNVGYTSVKGLIEWLQQQLPATLHIYLCILYGILMIIIGKSCCCHNRVHLFCSVYSGCWRICDLFLKCEMLCITCVVSGNMVLSTSLQSKRSLWHCCVYIYINKFYCTWHCKMKRHNSIRRGVNC